MQQQHFIFNGKHFIPSVAHECNDFYGHLPQCRHCYIRAVIETQRNNARVIRLYDTPLTKYSGVQIIANECICFPKSDKVVTVINKMFAFTNDIILPRSPKSKHLTPTKKLKVLTRFDKIGALELTNRMKQQRSFFREVSAGDGHFYLNVLLWELAPRFQDATGICPDVLHGDWGRWIAQIHDLDRQSIFVIRGRYNEEFDFIEYDMGS